MAETQPLHTSPWRDIVWVAVVTVTCAVLAAYFELSEALFAQTRRWEHFQLDEWPVAAFVLALCLAWVSWRRNQQTLAQLQARRLAEARLAAALAENRELARQHLRLQEAERKHLARELHDELGQYLNAIKLDAVAMQDVPDSPSTAVAAARIVEATDHVHRAVSDMIRRLRPVGLDELGLVAALENCLDQWRQRLPQIRFDLLVTGEVEALGETLDLAIYRLIQEGLTNSYRHAGATHIEVRVSRSDGRVRLAVADDGRGMDLATQAPGFGLGGMRERVEMMGGTFSIRTSPGQGLVFEATLPAEEGP